MRSCPDTDIDPNIQGIYFTVMKLEKSSAKFSRSSFVIRLVNPLHLLFSGSLKFLNSLYACKKRIFSLGGL